MYQSNIPNLSLFLSLFLKWSLLIQVTDFYITFCSRNKALSLYPPLIEKFSRRQWIGPYHAAAATAFSVVSNDNMKIRGVGHFLVGGINGHLTIETQVQIPLNT